MSAYWGADHPAGETEDTPIMRPMKMELAPHARLGRRVNAITAMVILLVFHATLIVSGILNWDVPCEYHLSRFLVIYGVCGLLFVYLLLREWMFYARLGGWPSTTTFVLLCVFYAVNVGAGVMLTMYTIRSRDSCRITAPLLYRWCFAAALFCCILIGLCLMVPIIRCVARCCCAPIALCLIGCVETVGMDVDVGVMGSGQGGGDIGVQGRRAVEKQFIPAALMLCTGVLCAPCYFVYACFLSPICRPLSVCAFKLFEMCGCVSVQPDGALEFRNCFGEMTCGWLVRHGTQCLMSPGMTTPGRSIVGAFVNTTALLWFWSYLLFELYWNWNLMCDSAAPDSSSDLTSAATWFSVLSPSPLHWLILVFAVTGLVATLTSFIVDMFTSPRPPPRSAFEVHKWKMRRQLRVCMNLILFALFCVWGGLLAYFVQSQEECASSAESIYRLAQMLLLVFFLVVGMAAVLLSCVCLDCCLSGRMRLVLLLSDDPTRVGPAAGESKGSDGFLVGATKETQTKLASEAPQLDRTTTLFTKADKNQMSSRLLSEAV